MNKEKDAHLIQKIALRVSQEAGLSMSQRMIVRLSESIDQRMHDCNISQFSEYAAVVLKSRLGVDQELTHLIDLLVNTETYFFRDKGQFLLLHDRILPDLIAKNKLKKSLKIWSAGCSSGQEPFSIAILLRELIPDWKEWNIDIIGTDINASALKIAERGAFSLSSARRIDPKILQRYFIQSENAFKLLDSVCRMVRFKKLNLVKDNYTSVDPGLKDIDLVLCRNVFIYFHKDAITDVIKKIEAVLSPGGVLITGHGELIGIEHHFKMDLTKNSMIYVKKSQR